MASILGWEVVAPDAMRRKPRDRGDMDLPLGGIATAIHMTVATSAVGSSGLGESQSVATTATGTIAVFSAQVFQLVQTFATSLSNLTGSSGDMANKRYRR